MCGICMVIYNLQQQRKDEVIDTIKSSRLGNRGPDCQNYCVQPLCGDVHAILCGCVLHLRGHRTPQPLIDNDDNVLLWNGEIFGGIVVETDENDGRILLNELQHNQQNVHHVMSRIQGPWSFIYWQKKTMKLWFGRDVLGRRSLLLSNCHDSCDVTSVDLALSSVAWGNKDWIEVPAMGIYCLQLSESTDIDWVRDIMCHPWNMYSDKEFVDTGLKQWGFAINRGESIHSSIAPFNISLPSLNEPRRISHTESRKQGSDQSIDPMELFSNAPANLKTAADQLMKILHQAVDVRVSNKPRLCNRCMSSQQPHLTDTKAGHYAEAVSDQPGSKESCDHAKVAILFSGGLDCMAIAALTDRCVDISEPIELLNVAFEQRIQESSKQRKTSPIAMSNRSEDSMFNVPDRVSGRIGLQELKHLNPHRQWNFVEINVTVEQLQILRRDHIASLVYPLKTVLDDSIGCAIWCAARGQGHMMEGSDWITYDSTARVVLVGMGADEQLAGYSRHRVVFNQNGWKGLVEEIDMEIKRISARNLGRDDRVITDHSKEARLPFLDENVVSFLNQLPIWQKANLFLPRGLGEKYLLRLAMWDLGCRQTAILAKRAIQFGSKIAKCENRREKATDICTRLNQEQTQEDCMEK